MQGDDLTMVASRRRQIQNAFGKEFIASVAMLIPELISK